MRQLFQRQQNDRENVVHLINNWHLVVWRSVRTDQLLVCFLVVHHLHQKLEMNETPWPSS